MSLFIGNVSKKVTQKQFEDAFKTYGRCKVDLRKRYAFVQYENQRNAEDAKQELQNTNFCGLKLNIQWSKNSGRFNQNGRTRTRSRKSPSRERSWRKQQRWNRRSPSYQKRSAPTYSDNQDWEDFLPQCPRDQEIIAKLKSLKQQGQMISDHHHLHPNEQENHKQQN